MTFPFLPYRGSVIDGRNDFLGDFRQGIGVSDMSKGRALNIVVDQPSNGVMALIHKHTDLRKGFELGCIEPTGSRAVNWPNSAGVRSAKSPGVRRVPELLIAHMTVQGSGLDG